MHICKVDKAFLCVFLLFNRRAVEKPIGILHVKVLRARKLLSKDLLGASDPYVQLSIDGEMITAKKTTVKRKTLNPEWNEDFKLTVKDPHFQVLQLHLYDWDKVQKAIILSQYF